MKCFRCNFVPFFLQTSLKVGNSTGSSLSHFALQNVPRILYWRQVVTAGRPVKYPYPLPPQPGLCMCAECGFALSCWNMHGRPWKRCLLEGSILCSKISMYFSALMVPSQKCKFTFAKGTDTTPYHDRPWLLDLLLVTVWMILFFFGHGVRSSQKIPEILIHLTTVHVSTVWWSIPDASEPREVDGASGHYYIGLPFGTVQLTGNCGCNYVLWYLTKVCQSSPEPMWWYRL